MLADSPHCTIACSHVLEFIKPRKSEYGCQSMHGAPSPLQNAIIQVIDQPWPKYCQWLSRERLQVSVMTGHSVSLYFDRKSTGMQAICVDLRCPWSYFLARLNAAVQQIWECGAQSIGKSSVKDLWFVQFLVQAMMFLWVGSDDVFRIAAVPERRCQTRTGIKWHCQFDFPDENDRQKT